MNGYIIKTIMLSLDSMFGEPVPCTPKLYPTASMMTGEPAKISYRMKTTIFFLVFLENLLTNDNGRKPSNFTKASFTKRMPTFKS